MPNRASSSLNPGTYKEQVVIRAGKAFHHPARRRQRSGENHHHVRPLCDDRGPEGAGKENRRPRQRNRVDSGGQLHRGKHHLRKHRRPDQRRRWRCGRRATNRSFATAVSWAGRTRFAWTASGSISRLLRRGPGRFHFRKRDGGVREMSSSRHRRRRHHRRQHETGDALWLGLPQVQGDVQGRQELSRRSVADREPPPRSSNASWEKTCGPRDGPSGRGRSITRRLDSSNTRTPGPAPIPTKRPAWTRQLSDAEAKSYTVENILGGTDRWNPRQ